MIELICESEILKAVFRGLNVLVNEARFRFDENGLHVRAVDPANVAMVIVNVPVEALETYNGKQSVVGVDVARLYEFMKSVKKDELVDLTVDDGQIRLKAGSIEYSTSTIHPTAIRAEPKIPNLELPVKMVLDAGEFRKAISAVDRVSDEAVFRSDEAGFYIEAHGSFDRILIEFSDLVDFNHAEAESMFSVEYLKEFCKVAGGRLTVQLGTNYPVWLTFELDKGASVGYVLAPRIETG